MTVHVKPETHAVGPVKPVPPHWPYCWTVPGAGETPVGADDAVDFTVEEACDAEDAEDTELTPVGLAALPPGTVVGTVEGWRAVFQVAVVGQAVVATEGEGKRYGLGPGTGVELIPVRVLGGCGRTGV